MAGPAFVRVYPTDWRSGCLGLSLEQEGLYIRMCMFLAETARRVPLDDTEASRMLNVQTRNYRRVLGELLRLGKIKRHNDGYGNDRIEYERDRAKAATDKKSNREHPAATERSADREADQGQNHRENSTVSVETEAISPNYSRSNGVITELAAEIPKQNQSPFIEPIPRTIDSSVVARETDWKLIETRLAEAAGPIMQCQSVAPGLANLSTPLWWIDQGCDLERDIIPTIREVAKRRAGKSKVSSWDFFTAAVANAKAKREGKLPEHTASLVAAVAKPDRHAVARDLINRLNAGERFSHA